MQGNAISCVLGTKSKMKLFYFIIILQKNSNEQKIGGFIIDNKLNIKTHINEWCKKVYQKTELYVACQAI